MTVKQLLGRRLARNVRLISALCKCRIERKRSHSGPPFERRCPSPLLRQEMIHRRQQKCAETPTFRRKTGEVIACDETGEEFLGQVLSIEFIKTLASHITIEWLPIGGTKLFQSGR